MDLKDIRKTYSKATLSEKSLHDPMPLFQKWMEEAIEGLVNEPTAMMLSTVSEDHKPSSRMVLLKLFSKEGFHFFTNYNSFKGQQLAENPRGCLVFFWKELERQVRITGLVGKTQAGESDNYFNSRSMDVYITKLRKYLKEDDSLEIINIHGKGFKLLVNN